MLRKISTKALPNDEKPKKLELKQNDNEYYLPHPQNRPSKPLAAESSFDREKDKLQLKYPRKGSRTGPMRTYSTTHLKNDMHNLSKDCDAPNITKNNNARKV